MSIKKIEGATTVKDVSIAVVVSKWNSFITEKLLEGAIKFLQKAEIPDKQITVVHCPGAYEIPLTAKMLIETGNYDGIACLGAVIRGDTPHFDYVCETVNNGIAGLNLQYNLPITFGVLTTDNIDQAVQRSTGDGRNKGVEAAEALLEMIDVSRKIKEQL